MHKKIYKKGRNGFRGRVTRSEKYSLLSWPPSANVYSDGFGSRVISIIAMWPRSQFGFRLFLGDEPRYSLLEGWKNVKGYVWMWNPKGRWWVTNSREVCFILAFDRWCIRMTLVCNTGFKLFLFCCIFGEKG